MQEMLPPPGPADHSQGAAVQLPGEFRTWLAELADLLIPAGSGMPAASQVGVAAEQLDLVVRARPDLTRHLLRAWASTEEAHGQGKLDILQALDVEAYDAVRMAVAGGYYTNREVRDLLGYTGQQPVTVRVDRVPEYVEEELLDRVMERGPIFRDA